MPATGFLHRRRVSRETRRLLSAAALALLTLWLLARVRYPDASIAPNPVPPLLAQLAPPARFSELAAEVSTLTGLLRDNLAVTSVFAEDARTARIALRVKPGIAVMVTQAIDPPKLSVASQALALDRPSGLMLVPVDQAPPVSLPRPWRPPQRTGAEYLFATSVATDGGIAVHPVLFSGWTSTHSPTWLGDVWRLPDQAAPSIGSFLFTASGELAGLVANDASDAVLVPASLLYSAVDTLSSAPPVSDAGWVGITVAGLSEQLAAATGTSRGVIVTVVDPRTAVRGRLRPGDVIVSVNEHMTDSVAEWAAVVDRLRVHDVLRLQVGSQLDEIEVTAIAVPDPPVGFGARLRRVRRQTEVVSVEPRSAAAAAGLEPGDVIVRAADVDDPTPGQVETAFASRVDVPLLVLFARASNVHATTVAR